MATHNPDPGLFATQIASIREQTDRDWVCVVSDDCSDPQSFERIGEVLCGDARFSVSRSGAQARLLPQLRAGPRARTAHGRAASRSPIRTTAGIREKLATLREALGPARLVYSDQRLVTPGGEVLSEHLLDEAPQQPHQLRLAADREHGHGRGLADAARAARLRASVPAGSRRCLTTTTGSASSPSAAARSPTSTGRSTTTSSTRMPSSATPAPTPSRAGAEWHGWGGCGAGRGRPSAGARSTSSSTAGWRCSRRCCCYAAASGCSCGQARGPRALSRRRVLASFLRLACLRAPHGRSLGHNETLGAERRLAAGIVWRHALPLLAARRQRRGAPRRQPPAGYDGQPARRPSPYRADRARTAEQIRGDTSSAG